MSFRSEILRDFQKPPAEYRPVPLWVWNGDVSETRITEILEQFASLGFGGVFVHPRPGLITEYLSTRWFELWNYALRECVRLGLICNVYDENSYPAGFAGGHIPAANRRSQETTMKYRTFGRLGWKVSQIGFGSWAIGGEWGSQSEDDSVKALHRAIDLGLNFIDTARVYGNGKSERLISQVLRDRRGERVYVATKVPPKLPGDWPPSPYDTIEDRYPTSHIHQQVEESLVELKVECLDLVQIHTWSMGWNRNPEPLLVLEKLRKQGKLRGIGLSTPEQDQNSVVEIILGGLIDSIQVIYNIFEQEAQAALFPAALERNVAVIGRCPFDESTLGGKLTPATTFPEGDFRRKYLAGDRLQRATQRVEKIREVIGNEKPNTASAALKFALKPAAVSTVIPGMRNPRQAELNCATGDAEPMSNELEKKLRTHYWRRGFWYMGK